MAPLVRFFTHIAAKLVAKPRLVLSKKEQKLKTLRSSLREIQKIRRRGYHIVTKDGITTHKKFDSAEKEYLRSKEEKIKVAIDDLIPEIKEHKDTFKLRATRSKNAYMEDRKINKQKARNIKAGRQVVKKVSVIVNNTNIAEYPALAEFAKTESNDATSVDNLLDFFSKNLTDVYGSVSKDSDLKDEVLRQTKNYLKEITR